MSGTTEILESIAEKLDSLPDRLAAILGRGTESPGTASRQKPPGLLDATERLMDSLGGTVQGSGLSQAMKPAEKTRDALGDFGRASSDWTSRAGDQISEMASKDSVKFSGQPLPSVAKDVQFVASRLASDAVAGSGPLEVTRPQERQDDTRSVLKELVDVMKQLRDSLDQADPDPSEDAERKQHDRQSMWREAGASAAVQQTTIDRAGNGCRPGNMRPPQDVPSAERATQGDTGESIGSVIGKVAAFL